MKMQTLLDFVSKENKLLSEKHPGIDKEKKTLAQTVKLSEELGELSEEVLASLSLQRQHKLDNMKKDNLSKEFADVLITALILADTMGVDIRDGLKRTIKKVNNRYKP
ncbi:MAG: hypothetical protein GOU98_02165 [Candidatus Altiarchaeota archaeon]|nr:hypothetical protein [Candidatus Altiarchaeota archaeon]